MRLKDKFCIIMRYRGFLVILVKCKDSFDGRAYYGITLSKLEITEQDVVTNTQY